LARSPWSLPPLQTLPETLPEPWYPDLRAGLLELEQAREAIFHGNLGDWLSAGHEETRRRDGNAGRWGCVWPWAAAARRTWGLISTGRWSRRRACGASGWWSSTGPNGARPAARRFPSSTRWRRESTGCGCWA